MGKYIIDIDDNDIQKIVALGVTNCGAVYTRKYDIDDDIEELTIDYIKENCKSLLNAEYQRGFEDGKAVNERGCEGCKYSEKEFVRGDVVVDEDGTRGIVVSSENNESNLLYVLFKGYRVPQSVVRKHYKKTGEHYDIDKFLDEIKGEGDK